MSNSKLLARDLLERVAEYLGVLERNIGEQNDLRADDVRRVEPTPEAGFDDGHLDVSVGEVEKRGRCQHLELRGPDLLRGVANARDGPFEARWITIQPLVPAGNVWRGVRAHA